MRVRIVWLTAAISFLCAFSLRSPAQNSARSQGSQVRKTAEAKRTPELGDNDALNGARRAFAISLLMSLGNEARSYSDLGLRPRVLARTADVLWDVDSETARALFNRAWEAAERGDAEEVTIKTKDNPPAMVVALRRMGGRDLRAEVVSIVAKRDPNLGEELLAKLKKESEREAEESKNTRGRSDNWSASEAALKRLLIARKLLEDGQVESALVFAGPALDQVNEKSIRFLSALRKKNPEPADQRFAILLARAEIDPSSDANTVSGLASYAFTPSFYIVFTSDGQTLWSQPEDPFASMETPNLPSALRQRFFQVAAMILLRPLPPRDQDFSTAGRWGKYMVIRRLLPLFDQYAPDSATALRAQLTELKGNSSKEPTDNGSRFLTEGIKPEPSARDIFEKMQNDLDYARTSRERDDICAAAAVRLASKGDFRARDVVDKIDDSERRAKIREYVDFEFIRVAIRKKDAQETARLAKESKVTHAQRAWAYAQAARILSDSQHEDIARLLDEAIAEIQRIQDSHSDQAVLLVAVARRFLDVDRERAWQTMSDALKEANRADNFTGESVVTFWISAGGIMKFNKLGGEDGGLPSMFALLVRDDLDRSVELARSLKNDGPRAAAILAIADALLKEPRKN